MASLLQTWLCVAAVSSAPNVEVIKFTATWCAPCQAMEPVLEQVARQGISIRRIDVDQRRDLATQYQVTNLPTLLIVSGGQVVDRIEGAIPLEELQNRLAPHASSAASAPLVAPTPDVEQHPPTAAPRHANAPSSIGWQPVERQATEATVRLRIEDANGHSYGTGTVVDVHGQDALILTCGHIFRDSQGKGRISVDLFTDGTPQTVQGELIRYDLKRDLALIGMRSTIKIKPIPIASPADRLQPGQPLFSIGCNHGAEPSLIRGRLKAVDKYLGPENVTVEGRPTEGRSGGGLFSYEGRLIGVCNAADPEIDEGLYASFPSIHHHLDDADLSFVYRGAAQPSVQLAAAQRSSGPRDPALTPLADDQEPDLWASVAKRRGEPFPERLPSRQGAIATGQEAEVICIIRTRDQPASASRVVVLDRPSRGFLSQLDEEHRAQAGRRMTQMRVRPSGSPTHRSASRVRRLHVPHESTNALPR